MTSVSQTLRQAREAKGITLEEVAQRTYIKLPYLQALEDGDVDKLPAPVYIHGYIRQYAKLLGLNGSDLVLRYQQDSGKPQPPKIAIATPQAKPDSVRRSLEVAMGATPHLPGVSSLTGTMMPSSDPESLRTVRESTPMPALIDPEPSVRRPLGPVTEAPRPAPLVDDRLVRMLETAASMPVEPAPEPAAPVGVEHLAQAKYQASQIISTAQREAHELRVAAERYADQVLAQLENEVSRSLQTVRNGRAFLQSRRRKLQET